MHLPLISLDQNFEFDFVTLVGLHDYHEPSPEVDRQPINFGRGRKTELH